MRKVKYAKFHGGIFLPNSGIGLNVGDTLPPTTKTVPSLQMFAGEVGLLVNVGGTENLVPWANVIVVQYEKDNTQ